MDFRIADTFTASLTRLTGEEQKAVKQTAFDLQLDPSNPGMQFHKLDKAKDKRFWSVRVSSDIRLIVHRSESSLLVCYVGHHDDAYRWAERRKIEVHPRTGAAQLVEIRERVEEVVIPRYVEAEAASRPVVGTVEPPRLLFDGVEDDELLALGVPAEWVPDAKSATEDSLFDLAAHLPAEAAEALLELATGGRPQPAVAAATVEPFHHPDAQRRFRVVANAEELQRALEFPWERWTVFLHPSQRDLVERAYSGPARVAGSAGTGKTVVALHRAAHLARVHPEARVLLTTFSLTLARALRVKLDRLVGNELSVRDRITVSSIDDVGIDLYTRARGKPSIPTAAMVRSMLRDIAQKRPESKFSVRFLEDEWTDVVDAWQLATWEAYRDVQRLGRKTRVGEKQRAVLWDVFAALRTELRDRGLMTRADAFAGATESIQASGTSPFDFAVVDEAQDVGVPQLRLLAAIGRSRPDALFFAGDLGQRIFQTPFSWKSLGIDVVGRSHTLRINYRTSHQIRAQADRLLPPELADVDGQVDARRGTISVFEGPPLEVLRAASEELEIDTVAGWLAARAADGVLPHEIGLFVRSDAQLARARTAIKAAGLEHQQLDGAADHRAGTVALSPMHLAKGMEFRAVAVMACEEDVVPLQERIAAVSDNADLEEVYNTERHLLYVACTRAREHLLVSGVEPVSEFVDDLEGE